MRRSLWIVATMLVLAVGAPSVRADGVVVSNLTQTAVGVDFYPVNAAAQSFTTGGTAETLSGVTLALLGGAGAVDVSLFADSSGLPGSSLLSLGTLTPTGGGFADYTATGSFALAADTTYWVVVDYLGAQSWGYTDTTASTGTGILGAWSSSVDGGATWTGPYNLADDPFPYLLAVGATTPEPSGLVLLLAGIGAMLLFQRRGIRRSSSKATA
jgi:hypothetical protein